MKYHHGATAHQQPPVFRSDDGASARTDYDLVKPERPPHHFRFIVAEGSFSERLENVCDPHAADALHDAVRVDEGKAQPPGEFPADPAFTRPHEAGKGDPADGGDECARIRPARARGVLSIHAIKVSRRPPASVSHASRIRSETIVARTPGVRATCLSRAGNGKALVEDVGGNYDEQLGLREIRDRVPEQSTDDREAAQQGNLVYRLDVLVLHEAGKQYRLARIERDGGLDGARGELQEGWILEGGEHVLHFRLDAQRDPPVRGDTWGHVDLDAVRNGPLDVLRGSRQADHYGPAGLDAGGRVVQDSQAGIVDPAREALSLQRVEHGAEVEGAHGRVGIEYEAESAIQEVRAELAETAGHVYSDPVGCARLDLLNAHLNVDLLLADVEIGQQLADLLLHER